MRAKLITAFVVVPIGYLLPAAGNGEALMHPHLWVLVAMGLLGSVFQPTYKPIDGGAPAQDRGTATQIVWSVYVTQILGVCEAAYLRYPQSFEWDTVSWVAVLIVAAGLVLRTYAVLELGRFFTWHIAVRDGHRVVTTGPYRLVRHPGYAGGWLMYVFSLVLLHAWASALLAAMALGCAFWRRIRYEEQWLNRHLGDDYRRYALRVKAFIPYLL